MIIDNHHKHRGHDFDLEFFMFIIPHEILTTNVRLFNGTSKLFCVLISTLLACLYLYYASTRLPRKVVIAAGPTGGNYYQLGNELGSTHQYAWHRGRCIGVARALDNLHRIVMDCGLCFTNQTQQEEETKTKVQLQPHSLQIFTPKSCIFLQQLKVESKMHPTCVARKSQSAVEIQVISPSITSVRPFGH